MLHDIANAIIAIVIPGIGIIAIIRHKKPEPPSCAHTGSWPQVVKAAVTATRLEAADPSAESAATSREAADAGTATTLPWLPPPTPSATAASGASIPNEATADKAVIALRNVLYPVPFSLSLSPHRSLPGPSLGCDTGENLERAWQAGLTLLNTLRLQDRASANRLSHLRRSARCRTIHAQIDRVRPGYVR